jgi:putative phage-type endonuclease
MDQQTAEWLEWRKKGIGASESAWILEKSPYGTRLDLWKLKTGRDEEKEFSVYANSKGGDTEHNLRSRHSLFTGKDFQPRLAEHDQYPFILASLDAYCEKTNSACEIKFVKKEYFDADFIQEHHMLQMQHQMLVLGIPEMEYLMSCDNGSTYKALTVKADKKIQNKILRACVKFQQYVTENRRPPLGPNDYREIKDKGTRALVFEWKRAKVAGSKKDMERYREQILPRLKHKKMRAFGVEISGQRFYFRDATQAMPQAPVGQIEPNPQG